MILLDIFRHNMHIHQFSRQYKGSKKCIVRQILNDIPTNPLIKILMGYSNIKTLVLVLLLCLQGMCQEPKLIYVQQVFRHGHRQPIYPSQKDGSSYLYEIKSAGELTKQGMSMHYILGQNLYKTYWDQLFSGTPYYNIYNQSKIYVKSTNVNRTIQSVQSQLLGIFENVDKLTLSEKDVPYSLPQWTNVNRQAGDVFVKSPLFSPIPVHVEKGYISPWDRGDFLRTYSPQFCPNQKIWQEQNKRDPNALKMVNDQSFVSAISSVRAALNITTDFWDVVKYYDNSVCMTYQGRQVNPIWTTQNATKNALDGIYNLQLYLDLFNTEQQLAVTATGYFNQTYNQFKRVTADQSGVQWAFYSAHDTTVANFIARLNLTNPSCIYDAYLKGIKKNSDSPNCIVEYPAYTSNLIFQVYKYRNNTFTMKLRYNGEYRKIPFCGDYECSVEAFYSWFNSWKVNDVAKQCGIVNDVEEKASTYFSIMVIELGIIIAFSISALYGYLNKKSDDQNNTVKPKAHEKKEESQPEKTFQGGKLKEETLKDSLISDQ